MVDELFSYWTLEDSEDTLEQLEELLIVSLPYLEAGSNASVPSEHGAGCSQAAVELCSSLHLPCMPTPHSEP